MQKRGISPLIATVLIIGFTVALGSVILVWGGDFVRTLQEGSDITAEKAEGCTATTLDVTNIEQTAPNKLNFLLENTGQSDIQSVIVRLTGDKGASSVTKPGLGSAGKKAYEADFNPDEVGTVNSVGVIPNIKIREKTEPCTPGIEMESDAPSTELLQQWDLACPNGAIDTWEECDPNASPAIPADKTCESLGYTGGTLACNPNSCVLDVSGCTGASTCGNGAVDTEEQCDYDPLSLTEIIPAGTDCTTLGFSSGTIGSCNTQTCTIDTTQCIPDICNNGVNDAAEQCDSTATPTMPPGTNCITQGFTGGVLECTSQCTYDTTQCYTCGSGTVEQCKYCDGTDLGDKTCADFGYNSGTLGCSSTCDAYDFSSCAYTPTCGNLVKETGEQCDTSDFGNKTCASLGFATGALSCSADCNTIDTSSCIPFTKITTGDRHTCALTSSGDVYCWGYNGNGQLGLGDITSRNSPTKINGFAGATELAAGVYHTCALKTDGTVWCWGYDSSGQLGDDATLAQKTTPVQAAITNVAKIRIGAMSSHTCALKTDGTVWCWGAGTSGQIGDNALINRPTPVQVNINGIVDLSLGAYYTCGLDATSNMYCWGTNSYGQYCSGVTTKSNIPILTLTGVTKISSSLYHTCVIKTDNKVYCCGYNAYGQIGNGGTASPVLTPYQVPLTNNAQQVSTAGTQSCAVDSLGDMYCWGTGYYYSMGGSVNGAYYAPRKNNMKNPSITTFGTYHGCAINTTGTYCWGWNSYGQIGSGKTGSPAYDVPSPMRINITSTGGCGNAKLDTGEACETNGQQLNSQNCTSQGFQTGRLKCSSACSLDTADCEYSRIATCGNGAKEQCEHCDGADIGGKTCTDLGFKYGTLGCSPACAFDISTCSNCIGPEGSGCTTTADCCVPFMCNSIFGTCVLY